MIRKCICALKTVFSFQRLIAILITSSITTEVSALYEAVKVLIPALKY